MYRKAPPRPVVGLPMATKFFGDRSYGPKVL